MSRSWNFAFKLVSSRIGDSMRTVARFTCSKCGGVIDVGQTSGSALNGEAIAKRAVRQGWAADGWVASAVICPNCLHGKKEFAVATPPVNIATVQAKASPDQRLKIRNALDENFDDAAGRYLGGMTDAKVAEKIGVPRALVETVREAAYGPLREDPAVMAAQRDVQSFGERLDTAEAAVRNLRTEWTALKDKVAKL